jgi:hypothetical protein
VHRYYRFRDLRDAGIPWTRKHIRHLEQSGRFPRRIYLGPNTVMWDAAEIDAFVAARAEARSEPAKVAA